MNTAPTFGILVLRKHCHRLQAQPPLCLYGTTTGPASSISCPFQLGRPVLWAGAEPVAAAPPVGAGLFWPESALFRPGTGAAAGLLRPEWVSCGRSSGSSGRGAALTPAGEETRSGLLLQPEQWSEQMAGRVWKNVPVFLVVTASLPP